MVYKCEFCEEEYDDSIKFRVFLIDFVTNNIEHGIVCPDCISEWFNDAPEKIKIINIERVEA